MMINLPIPLPAICPHRSMGEEIEIKASDLKKSKESKSLSRNRRSEPVIQAHEGVRRRRRVGEHFACLERCEKGKTQTIGGELYTLDTEYGQSGECSMIVLFFISLICISCCGVLSTMFFTSAMELAQITIQPNMVSDLASTSVVLASADRNR
jgi:hypothetical protein